MNQQNFIKICSDAKVKNVVLIENIGHIDLTRNYAPYKINMNDFWSAVNEKIDIFKN